MTDAPKELSAERLELEIADITIAELRSHVAILTARIADLERAGAQAVSSSTDWEMKLGKADIRIGELESALNVAKVKLTMTIHGMQDGALLRDLMGQVERLEAERDALRVERDKSQSLVTAWQDAFQTKTMRLDVPAIAKQRERT